MLAKGNEPERRSYLPWPALWQWLRRSRNGAENESVTVAASGTAAGRRAIWPG